MKNRIHFSDIEPLIQETLDMGKAFKISPNGTSMLPLIVEGRDCVYIKKPQERLKKYDIAFYKRPTGQYVLHRVVKVKKSEYVMCGDNQWFLEHGISDNNIIGVVSKLECSGKVITPQTPKYRCYCFWWVNTRVIRHMKSILRYRASKLYHKLKK